MLQGDQKKASLWAWLSSKLLPKLVPFFLLAFLLASFSLSPFSQATERNLASEKNAVHRTEYIRAAYNFLPNLIHYLRTSEKSEANTLSQEFLQEVEVQLEKANKPKLIFVNDSSKFVLRPGERPVAMRSPKDLGSPIYVNQELIDSPQFSLQLPQILKLLIHELGRKSPLPMDQWDSENQKIESLLKEYHLTSEEDQGSYLESIYIPEKLIQVPTVKKLFRLEPSFLIFHHSPHLVSNLTPAILYSSNKNAMQFQTLSHLFFTGLSSVANFFGGILGTVMGEISKAIEAYLSNLKKAGLPLDGPDFAKFRETFEPLKNGIQTMMLFEPQSLSLHASTSSILGSLKASRSHKDSFKMNVKGLPSVDLEIPIQIKLTSSDVHIQPLGLPQFDSTAQVSSIRREGSQLRSFDVLLDWKDSNLAFQIDAMLETPSDSLRLSPQTVELVGNQKLRVHYEIPPENSPYITHVEKLMVNNHHIVFFDRKIDSGSYISQKHIGHLNPSKVLENSVGLIGLRGNRPEFKNTFSSMEPSILFFAPLQEEKVFVIQPQNIQVQLEVANDVNIHQIELLWANASMITNFDKSQPNKTLSIDVASHYTGQVKRLRITESGSGITELKNFYETVVLTKLLSEEPSKTPGFKKVTFQTESFLNLPRDLKEDEALIPPMVIPFGVRVLTNDFKTYSQIFDTGIAEEDLDLKVNGKSASKIKEDLEESIRKSARKDAKFTFEFGENPNRSESCEDFLRNPHRK